MPRGQFGLPSAASLHLIDGVFIFVTLRSAQQTLESLRVTLQKLEHTSDSDEGGESMSALKSILLNRIAELEIAATLEQSDAESAGPATPADLVLPTSMPDAEPQNEAKKAIQPEALD